MGRHAMCALVTGVQTCALPLYAARDDLARMGSIDREAIERAAAAASGRDLLLRETQRDACFCGCRAGRNQILFGRHTLVEQTLFATEIALGERQSGPRGLNFGVARCRFTAFDDSERLPASDGDRQRTRLNSSHYCATRMPSSACKKK